MFSMAAGSLGAGWSPVEGQLHSWRGLDGSGGIRFEGLPLGGGGCCSGVTLGIAPPLDFVCGLASRSGSHLPASHPAVGMGVRGCLVRLCEISELRAGVRYDSFPSAHRGLCQFG